MKYKFNKEQLNFVEDKRGFKGWVKIIFRYFGLSILLALLYYVVFALLVSTDQERELARETQLMEQGQGDIQEHFQCRAASVLFYR